MDKKKNLFEFRPANNVILVLFVAKLSYAEFEKISFAEVLTLPFFIA